MATKRNDRYVRFYGPILDALRELGGSARPKEVQASVLQKVHLSEEELSRITKSGQSAVYNEIAWARDYLRRMGLIDGSEQGVWRLTEEGMGTKLSVEEARERRARLKQAIKADGSGTTEEMEPPTVIESGSPEDQAAPDTGGDLLLVMLNLAPASFERLCQRILREAGFAEVEVTGKTGDGGIDGRGILQLNELVSFRVMFQCKRYKGSVGVDAIRNFQAALQGRADKGIILTTGTFTRDAEREASREGGMPVELVDGERLTRLMQRLELGVHPRTVYDVDTRFFDQF
jgi:restriction system protein